MFVTKEYPNVKFENVEEYLIFKESLNTTTKIEEAPFDIVIIRREMIEDEYHQEKERRTI